MVKNKSVSRNKRKINGSRDMSVYNWWMWCCFLTKRSQFCCINKFGTCSVCVYVGVNGWHKSTNIYSPVKPCYMTNLRRCYWRWYRNNCVFSNSFTWTSSGLIIAVHQTGLSRFFRVSGFERWKMKGPSASCTVGLLRVFLFTVCMNTGVTGGTSVVATTKTGKSA